MFPGVGRSSEEGLDFTFLFLFFVFLSLFFFENVGSSGVVNAVLALASPGSRVFVLSRLRGRFSRLHQSSKKKNLGINVSFLLLLFSLFTNVAGTADGP